jgi:hypothetical protein
MPQMDNTSKGNLLDMFGMSGKAKDKQGGAGYSISGIEDPFAADAQ